MSLTKFNTLFGQSKMGIEFSMYKTNTNLSADIINVGDQLKIVKYCLGAQPI